MKAILAILLAGVVFYAYHQQQKMSSLESELEASRSEVVALKKEIAEAATTAASAPAVSKPSARRTPSGQWMWEQNADNPLAIPAPSQKHK